MQPSSPRTDTLCSGFQSSPAPKGRCNSPRRWRRASSVMFQSSPAPKGRCNQREPFVRVVARLVSILTGPEGPMQRRVRTAFCRVERFNPHRPRRADATPLNSAPAILRTRFQSSPAPKGRCNEIEAPDAVTHGQFQSSPAPKGRCNGAHGQDRGPRGVSILTGPEGPMQPCRPMVWCLS